ncbi:unnamed protein product [Acanthoscelides obtectus]|uniref:DDE Tnp4 domain-containing protein n=1 Tax=Acanthoscelides obtectus TaxID=200917 RepID=A0A9P0M2V3_ACAOB|nr:unnamed protein product [Acanthoscelides obtectus]CAK1639296.1 Protein ALP1-like [Acanthoscelides obtectus]
MDPCVVYLAYKYIIKKRRKRRWSVHPINSARNLTGTYYTLHKELRRDNDKFFNYYRMSIASFDELCEKLKNTFNKDRELIQGFAFEAEEMLSMTLRYLGSGCTYTELHYSYRLGVTTASLLIPRVCVALWRTLQEECFPVPTEQRWRQIAQDFAERTNFPNCIGSIDGKHCRIIAPAHSGSLNYNYKNFFSIVLLAIADSNCCFIYIDVGSYGKESDSMVFRQCSLFRKLEEDTLHIPKPEKVAETTLPYVLVGDEAFGLTNNLMRPYPAKNLTEKRRNFNYRLSRARGKVECSFGILTNKWRILHRPMNVMEEVAVSIIKACCILHNFVRVRDRIRFEDTLTITGLHDNDRAEPEGRGRKSAYKYRDAFADYFSSPAGAVPWQNTNI